MLNVNCFDILLGVISISFYLVIFLFFNILFSAYSSSIVLCWLSLTDTKYLFYFFKFKYSFKISAYLSDKVFFMLKVFSLIKLLLFSLKEFFEISTIFILLSIKSSLEYIIKSLSFLLYNVLYDII
jgi:hypothetical protein